jgi:hypothetical protein
MISRNLRERTVEIHVVITQGVHNAHVKNLTHDNPNKKHVVFRKLFLNSKPLQQFSVFVLEYILAPLFKLIS